MFQATKILDNAPHAASGSRPARLDLRCRSRQAQSMKCTQTDTSIRFRNTFTSDCPPSRTKTIWPSFGVFTDTSRTPGSDPSTAPASLTAMHANRNASCIRLPILRRTRNRLEPKQYPVACRKLY
eukprot:29628-Rhodomonas_salina.2